MSPAARIAASPAPASRDTEFLEKGSGVRAGSAAAKARNRREQAAGGAVLVSRRAGVADHRLQACGELLAKLDAPLVETVDVPDRAFHEDAVLIKGKNAPEVARIKPAIEERCGGAVAGKSLVPCEVKIVSCHLPGRQPCRRLFIASPRHQRFGLGEAVGEQQRVMMCKVRFMPLCGDQKFARHDAAALMQKLVEGMLAVGADLAPDNG